LILLGKAIADIKPNSGIQKRLAVFVITAVVRWPINNLSRLMKPMFCKTARCPSSQALLAYRHSELGLNEVMVIELHLRSCDFCNAELQLLRSHQIETEEYRFVEMPPHFHRLAENLLKRSVGSSMELASCANGNWRIN
jgi:hypothetical protein